jgi:dihydrofolate synthase/folylpolyglutamate synthase
MALACLDMPIARAAIDTGLMTAQLPGRQQVIQGPCQILLDVAHNPQAARLLAERFKQLPRSGKVRAIFSAFADKDLSGTIAPLVDLVDHWHYAPLTAGRAASLERLTEVLQNYSHSAHANMQEAFTAAIKQVQADDWLLVFGSFYTVAAIWEELKQCK